jgi:hypothetical protein
LEVVAFKRTGGAVVLSTVLSLAPAVPETASANPAALTVGGAAVAGGTALLGYYTFQRCTLGKSHEEAFRETERAAATLVGPIVKKAREADRLSRDLVMGATLVLAGQLIGRVNELRAGFCPAGSPALAFEPITLDDFFEDQSELVDGVLVPYVRDGCPDGSSDGDDGDMADPNFLEIETSHVYRGAQLVILRSLHRFLLKADSGYGRMNPWQQQKRLWQVWTNHLRSLLRSLGIGNECWEDISPAWDEFRESVVAPPSPWWRPW